MPQVFLSYRRQDSSGHAGWLRDSLATELGEDQVVMDVDSIEIGLDFVKQISDFVARCDVLVAIIGPNWLTVTDADGKPRLEDPNDFVRLEIAAALKRDIRVVPVLVADARMPSRDDLPEDIQALALRHGLELSDERWDYDVSRLIRPLRKQAGKPSEPSPSADPPTTKPKSPPARTASKRPKRGGSKPGGGTPPQKPRQPPRSAEADDHLPPPRRLGDTAPDLRGWTHHTGDHAEGPVGSPVSKVVEHAKAHWTAEPRLIAVVESQHKGPDGRGVVTLWVETSAGGEPMLASVRLNPGEVRRDRRCDVRVEGYHAKLSLWSKVKKHYGEIDYAASARSVLVAARPRKGAGGD